MHKYVKNNSQFDFSISCFFYSLAENGLVITATMY